MTLHQKDILWIAHQSRHKFTDRTDDSNHYHNSEQFVRANVVYHGQLKPSDSCQNYVDLTPQSPVAVNFKIITKPRIISVVQICFAKYGLNLEWGKLFNFSLFISLCLLLKGTKERFLTIPRLFEKLRDHISF
jgi:hypothetical protein